MSPRRTTSYFNSARAAPSELLRALRRALDSLDERGPDAPLLERRHARDRSPTRARHHVLECTRMQTRLEEQLGRAQHRLGGECHGRKAVEAHLDTAVSQWLAHAGDIRRAGAGGGC